MPLGMSLVFWSSWITCRLSCSSWRYNVCNLWYKVYNQTAVR